MVRWLAIANRANWDVVQKKHVWGVPQRNRNIITRVKLGDTVLIYVGQEKNDDETLPSSVVGEFTVTSEAYEDHGHLHCSVADGQGELPLPHQTKPGAYLRSTRRVQTAHPGS